MNRKISIFVSTLLLSAILGIGNSYSQNSTKDNLSTSKTTEKMIVVKVTYTVNDEYISTNKELIQAFLKDFKKIDGSLFLYTILQSEDGKTFIHTSQYKNKEIQQILLNTPSFLHFQEQRDKNLASEPTNRITKLYWSVKRSDLKTHCLTRIFSKEDFFLKRNFVHS